MRQQVDLRSYDNPDGPPTILARWIWEEGKGITIENLTKDEELPGLLSMPIVGKGEKTFNIEDGLPFLDNLQYAYRGRFMAASSPKIII
jgi:hypothetical protein